MLPASSKLNLFVKILNPFLLDIWQWQDKQKNWQTYSVGLCRLLDAAVACELKTVSFEENKKKYTINMVTKERQEGSGKAGKSAIRHILEELAGR